MDLALFVHRVARKRSSLSADMPTIIDPSYEAAAGKLEYWLSRKTWPPDTVQLKPCPPLEAATVEPSPETNGLTLNPLPGEGEMESMLAPGIKPSTCPREWKLMALAGQKLRRYPQIPMMGRALDMASSSRRIYAGGNEEPAIVL
jgi:hypothetical protein